jgi:pimeloyl-ACP methyl ester carboxylesterase
MPVRPAPLVPLPIRLALVALATLADAEPARAGSRVSGCGGLNQEACPVTTIVTSCDPFLKESPVSCGSLCVQSICVLVGCSGTGQLACVPFVSQPDSDLCMANRFPYLGICRLLENGYPSVCGDVGELACTVAATVPLGIAPCRPGGYNTGYPGTGTCADLGDDGYPPGCGHLDQTSCNALVQGALIDQGTPILDCKLPLYDDAFPATGTCRSVVLDADGWPSDCGDAGEPFCPVTLIGALATRGISIAACKSPLDPFPAVDGNCYPPVDLSRPSVRPRPTSEAPSGRRTIVIVHGRDGGAGSLDRSTWRGFVDALAEGVLDRHQLYASSHNVIPGSRGAGPQYELLERNHDPSVVDGGGTARVWKSAPAWSDGELPERGRSHSIEGAAEQLAKALLAVDTEPNLTIVGHSMGGIITRQLVNRWYDDLLAAGKRITEVVILGSPHADLARGIPTLLDDASLIAVWGCGGALPSYDLCEIGRWLAGRAALGSSRTIDDRDHPEIRWLLVAGGGELSPGVGIFDADGVVPVGWALGPQADACLPHDHESSVDPFDDESRPTYELRVRIVEGQSAPSLVCHQASHTEAAGSPGHADVLDGIHHDYERQPVYDALRLFLPTPAGSPADADLDDVPDAADNCARWNPDQADRGGLGSGSAPDGVGDACQCGDVSGDGSVTLLDGVLIARSLLSRPTATLALPSLCDVGGSEGCTLADALIVRRAVLQPPTAVIAPACAP